MLPIRYRCAPWRDGRRCAALSIDDGPSRVTPELLRVLDEHDTKATFFVVGQRAANKSALLDEMVARGHEVFAHGWSHRQLDRMSGEELRGELERAEALLRRLRLTPRPYLVRLPYGASAEDPQVHAALRSWNPACEIVQWSLTPADWEISLAEDPGAACPRRRPDDGRRGPRGSDRVAA